MTQKTNAQKAQKDNTQKKGQKAMKEEKSVQTLQAQDVIKDMTGKDVPAIDTKGTGIDTNALPREITEVVKAYFYNDVFATTECRQNASLLKKDASAKYSDKDAEGLQKDKAGIDKKRDDSLKAIQKADDKGHDDFVKAYGDKGTAHAKDAVQAWFKAYDVDTTPAFCAAVVRAISGTRKASAKSILLFGRGTDNLTAGAAYDLFMRAMWETLQERYNLPLPAFKYDRVRTWAQGIIDDMQKKVDAATKREKKAANDKKRLQAAIETVKARI